MIVQPTAPHSSERIPPQRDTSVRPQRTTAKPRWIAKPAPSRRPRHGGPGADHYDRDGRRGRQTSVPRALVDNAPAPIGVAAGDALDGASTAGHALVRNIRCALRRRLHGGALGGPAGRCGGSFFGRDSGAGQRHRRTRGLVGACRRIGRRARHRGRRTRRRSQSERRVERRQIAGVDRRLEPVAGGRLVNGLPYFFRILGSSDATGLLCDWMLRGGFVWNPRGRFRRPGGYSRRGSAVALRWRRGGGFRGHRDGGRRACRRRRARCSR